MIRSVLHLGEAPAAPGANSRKAGRVVCERVRCDWGEVLNASASGMRILARARRLPDPGRAAVLTVQGPDRPFSVVARVVWSKQRNWGRREVGVQFVEVSPMARAQLMRMAEVAGRGVSLKGLTADGFRAAG
jgi:hypothetical protein